MPEAPSAAATAAQTSHAARILRIAMRTAVALLASGDQSDDVQDAITTIADAYGLRGVQASVTFSGIAISYDASGQERPTTMLHIVRDRTSDFSRLASATSLVRRIRDGTLTPDDAEAALDALERQPSPFGPAINFVAPGISAAGSTIIFGGNVVEALATMVIAFVVQPALGALDRSTLPPFFRLAFGATASTLLVALLVGLGLPIVGGLVLTGSLLRFLPGYALVSGLRDLIDQSIISGTARLAEAVLLGAAVAGGTALGLTLASAFGVSLSVVTFGHSDWGRVAAGLAALFAVGGYAVRLGVPQRAAVQAAVLGAVAWSVFIVLSDPSLLIDPALATLGSAIGIGVVGRLLATRAKAPSALWVVPAILPLLPGLQMVLAMLSRTDAARLSGLLAAVGTAFLVGTGVASGDIVVLTVQRLRERVVDPAVRAVAGDIDVLIATPVERVVGRARDAGSSVARSVAEATSGDAPDDRSG